MLSKSSIGLASAFALIGALGAADPAWAGSKIFAPLGTTLTMSSTIEQNAVGNLDPFTVEVFGAPGECLRIAQTTGADLFAVLVSPNQTVWRDDDSNGSLHPRINAVVQRRGWHVLTITTFNGAAASTSDFTWTLSRLASSACSPATLPSLAAAAAAAKSGSAGPRVVGGTN